MDLKEAEVHRISNCDICKTPTLAYADALVPFVGTWGYVCDQHFKQHHCELGLGKGQILKKVGN